MWVAIAMCSRCLMNWSVLFLFLSLSRSLWLCRGCQQIEVFGETVGKKTFHLYRNRSHDAGGGRASFVSVDTESDSTLYLYHVVVNQNGSPNGRWVLNDQFGSITQAIAFADSWAIMPHLVTAINPHATWKIFQNEWKSSPNFTFSCLSGSDGTFFLDSPDFWQLSGFYVQIERYVFTQIKLHYPKQLYFYKYLDQWILGDDPRTDIGLAYVVDRAESPRDIKTTSNWFFLQSSKWISNSKIFLIQSPSQNDKTIYDALRDHRSLPIPSPVISANSRSRLSSWRLSNGLPIPVIGLGTGGISTQHLPTVLRDSYALGYRLFDLAREYRNEDIFGRLTHEADPIPTLKGKRNELFLISKVWPTYLGFDPTIQQVIASLNNLRTSYLDMYLLHWPECLKTISWMHCETTIDPSGTWRDSYRALERLYQEGHLLSIGISNFNRPLLDQLTNFATVMPHAVQNHGEIYQYDLEVRRWCRAHQVIYIPYATGRNLKDLPSPVLETLKKFSKSYNVSKNAIASQLFIQSGAVIIPRSTKLKHLEENIHLLSWELTSQDRSELGWSLENERLVSEEDQILFAYRSGETFSEVEVNL